MCASLRAGACAREHKLQQEALALPKKLEKAQKLPVHGSICKRQICMYIHCIGVFPVAVGALEDYKCADHHKPP